MEIKVAELDNLQDIVNFHKAVFKDYYLTQLGDKMLSAYYRELIGNSDNICLLAINENQICGLSLFVVDFDKFIKQFYKDNLLLLLASISRKIISFNPIVWAGTLDRVQGVFKKKDSGLAFPDLTLLSLAVREEYQGKGIAGKLINFGEKIYKERGYDDYYLSVKRDNQQALKFYEKIGFLNFEEDSKLYYLIKKLP